MNVVMPEHARRFTAPLDPSISPSTAAAVPSR